MKYPKLICIVGTRPNFVKIAPIMQAMQQIDPTIALKLVHTGQHYDPDLTDIFFEHLNIPQPNFDLKVGSCSHNKQIANIMLRLEGILVTEKPTAILVVGDVNSTLASSLTASKLQIPIIHVEAGLRSFEKNMPEEVNRILTDQLASLHFVPEIDAKRNLLKEGINILGIHLVGNVMIDTLVQYQEQAISYKKTFKFYNIEESESYGVITLHRPDNVDNLERLEILMNALLEISQKIPLIFPCHPRTKKQLQKIPFFKTETIKIIEPLNYLSMLGLIKQAKIVFTDSGGLQEETTALRIPCLTLREKTERPVTLTHGTNQLVGTNPVAIKQKATEIICGKYRPTLRTPPLWDGQSARRIAQLVSPWLHSFVVNKMKMPEYSD